MDHLAFEVSSRVELEAREALLRECGIVFTRIAETPISIIVFWDPGIIQLEFCLSAT